MCQQPCRTVVILKRKNNSLTAHSLIFLQLGLEDRLAQSISSETLDCRIQVYTKISINGCKVNKTYSVNNGLSSLTTTVGISERSPKGTSFLTSADVSASAKHLIAGFTSDGCMHLLAAK